MKLKLIESINEVGLFRWAKNNELVDTDDKRFRDSVHGVVPVEDDAPRFGGNSEKTPSEPESASSRSSPLPEHTVNESNGDQTPSTQEDYELKKDVKKSSRVNPAAIYDRFAGSLSVKKGMWIFVSPESSYFFRKVLPNPFSRSPIRPSVSTSASKTLVLSNIHPF